MAAELYKKERLGGMQAPIKPRFLPVDVSSQFNLLPLSFSAVRGCTHPRGEAVSLLSYFCQDVLLQRQEKKLRQGMQELLSHSLGRT